MSIRDAIAFIFGPSKASVEPVSRTDDLREVLVKRDHTFQGQGIFGAIGNPIADSQRQHPLAPEREPPPLDWASWSWMREETFRRGWAFARFAVKSPPPENRIGCVFGIVRGPWGIAKMDFYLCGNGVYDTLNAITHLPSGMGCGLFTDQEAAATACDIAARLADDWETLDPYADGLKTGQAIARMHSAWVAAGLTKCATHAHATKTHDSPQIPIWFQDYSAIIMGKPEKMS